ncbi:hypothetical protein [Pseudomonas sp. CC120222-01a]|uniref:hypothetical protein n=1 Tax=Pseudomonas sp. CC120222-01a TaxID=1378075 RepID=UPI00105835E7|nr:hypothetical protein [Pseudomonas sp. CC120222-01a]
MSNSSIKNAENRFIWLEQLLNSQITLTPDLIPYLKDLRTFCSLKIPGFFTKISYNTLQKATLDPKASYPTNANARDRWELMKTRREQAYQLLQKTFQPAPPPQNSKSDDRDSKAEIKECLWHATQCSQAYLELYRALKIFVDQPANASTEIDRITLKNILDKSRITYLNIISSEPSPEPGNLRVIEGGKDA